MELLETAYEEILRDGDLLIKDESTRRLRLRILLLETENDDLHEQLALADEGIDTLAQECNELRQDVNQAQGEVLRTEMELKKKARELININAELITMNEVTTNSTRLLTEKLSLAREIATLKPELEHLRSQAIQQRNVLADKLALQRQVAMLEVELETEKRAAKRFAKTPAREERLEELQSRLETMQGVYVRENLEKEKAHEAILADLYSQIQTLRTALACEKRGKEQARGEMEAQLRCQYEKDTEKERNAFETQRVVLENKITQLKTSLTATRSQLDECRKQLNRTQATLSKSTAEIRGAESPTNPLKQGIKDLNRAIDVDTPAAELGCGRRTGLKRVMLDSASLAEKSLFSITPYLNRTTSIVTEVISRVDGSSDQEGQTTKQSIISPRPTSLKIENDGSCINSVSPVISKARGRNKAAKTRSSANSRSVIAGVSTTKANQTVVQQVATKSSNRAKRVAEGQEVEEEDGEEEGGGGEEEDDAEEEVGGAGGEEEEVGGAGGEEEEEEVGRGGGGGGGGGKEPGEEIDKNHAVQGTNHLAKAKQRTASERGVGDREDEAIEPRKKKRKLLGVGKTLFDEEDLDGELIKRPGKLILAPPGILSKTTRGHGSKPTSHAAFNKFSPLKKDKRGVGASFLS